MRFTQYVNRPTQRFVTELRSLIAERTDAGRGGVGDEKITNTLWELEALCETLPAILQHVADLTSRLNRAGTYPEQIELLQLATIVRSASTYATIPDVVARLEAIGDYKNARILAKNLRDEAGGEQLSHPELLLKSFKTVGKATDVRYLTPASFQIILAAINEESGIHKKQIAAVQLEHSPAWSVQLPSCHQEERLGN